MRAARILGWGASSYHVMSRIVDRRFIFSDPEKEVFRKTMRCLEQFCGVEVLTYALMSNHFHILLHVPEARPLDEGQFRRRLGAIYPRRRVAEIMAPIEMANC